MKTISLLIVLLATAAAASLVAAQAPSVTIADGTIVGTYHSYAGLTAQAYLGIPYASPPNGTLRFQPPTPPTPWTTPLDASQAGPGCQQVCDLPPGLCPPVISEDCLYLNVFAPIGASSGDGLPVMVWIHGGNFRQGSGSTGLYDGTVFVNTSGIILVSMNYRMGAFGFFFNSASTANNGMLDQQFALQWVNNNIAAFGGDNSQITIFGQSAGGTSVSSHLQNPDSQKLFDRAIIESIPLGIPIRFADEAEKLNADFAQALNCDINDLACLQAADASAVLAAQESAGHAIGPDWNHLLEIAQPWEPTIGQTSFPLTQPLTDFFQSYKGDKPIMMGTVSQEAYVFIYEAVNSSMGLAGALALETAIFGLGSLGTLGDLYPLYGISGNDNRPVISELGSDELFVCAARNATDGMYASTGSDVPIYLYLFDHVIDNGQAGWGPDYQICWSKVCHGSEVPFVFGSAQAGGSSFSPDEVTLSNTMIAYWTNFAKTGNPNKGLDVPTTWPTVSGTRQTLYLSTNNVTVIENNHGDKCDYLDTLGYAL